MALFHGFFGDLPTVRSRVVTDEKPVDYSGGSAASRWKSILFTWATSAYSAEHYPWLFELLPMVLNNFGSSAERSTTQLERLQGCPGSQCEAEIWFSGCHGC